MKNLTFTKMHKDKLASAANTQELEAMRLHDAEERKAVMAARAAEFRADKSREHQLASSAKRLLQKTVSNDTDTKGTWHNAVTSENVYTSEERAWYRVGMSKKRSCYVRTTEKGPKVRLSKLDAVTVSGQDAYSFASIEREEAHREYITKSLLGPELIEERESRETISITVFSGQEDGSEELVLETFRPELPSVFNPHVSDETLVEHYSKPKVAEMHENRMDDVLKAESVVEQMHLKISNPANVLPAEEQIYSGNWHLTEC